MERLAETCHFAALVIEAHKKWVKAHFDQIVSPRTFVEGDLILLYEKDHDNPGVGKFEPMWHGPYIVKRVSQNEAYELSDYEFYLLDQPINGLYLEKYYA